MTTPFSRFAPFLTSINVPSEMITTKENTKFVELRASYLGVISVSGGTDLNILVELNNFDPKLGRDIKWDLFLPVLNKIAKDHFVEKILDTKKSERFIEKKFEEFSDSLNETDYAQYMEIGKRCFMEIRFFAQYGMGVAHDKFISFELAHRYAVALYLDVPFQWDKIVEKFSFEEPVIKCDCGNYHNGGTHTCPKKSELYGDDFSTCNCCETCTNNCREDI